MKIAILCGGPSLERGISLNSARSVLDHLNSNEIEVIPFYLDYKKRVYKISRAQLYSNTPSDFDFKLQYTSTPLSQKQFINQLKNVNLVFPIIHGAYGEDGGIQSFLEKNKIPFIGSGSAVCKKAFDKYSANQFIKKLGFYTLPAALLKIYHHDHKKIIKEFFIKNNIKRAIIKPASGGSSIGVFSANTIDDALEKTNIIFSKRMDTKVVLEPFAEGVEFTVIILQNKFNLPVAIIPTEIEIDYSKNQIFDYRRKYLPTRQVTYHCPPRFSNDVIEKIQVQAEQIFMALGMKDFGRFDGWVLRNGQIWFSDFNPISGMEQNSFLFQQSSRIGLSHADVLKHIVNHASQRYNIEYPIESSTEIKKQKKPIYVLFGGKTAERQVSLMTGTNIWLKLRKSKKYYPKPYLLDFNNKVWQLPYQLTLNHTVEEIIDNCNNAIAAEKKLTKLENHARLRLGYNKEKNNNDFFNPFKINFDDFLNKVKNKFVFIGLHGGFGENGELQKKLKDNNSLYNGPDEKISELCINKDATKKKISQLKISGISIIAGEIINTVDLFKYNPTQYKEYWKKICKKINCKSLIIKPNADGCSAGVAHLYSADELQKYCTMMKQKNIFIPKNTFKNQTSIIEMPLEISKSLLLEKYIDTDKIHIKANKLKYSRQSGWIEVTIGIIEDNNDIKVFNPSITVSEGEVLTVEEKFQGGTGINITPPPTSIIKFKTLEKTKQIIKKLAVALGIKGYSRIDAFMHVNSGEVMIIEINTLPALTPSTVFYQQALVEDPIIYPRQLLEKLIENKNY